jgi:hypothetical protein
MGTDSWDHPQGGKVFRTLDGGATWQGVAVDVGYCISSLAVDPLNTAHVWAVSGNCGGYPDHTAVYSSTDGGLSFNLVFTSTNGYEFSQLGFDAAGNLFLLGDGLRLSHNGGITFTAEMFAGSIPWWDNQSLIFDAQGGKAYIRRGGLGTWVSDDGGKTWQPSSLPALCGIDPDNSLNLFSAKRPGISRSLNGGQSWQDANAGLEHVIVEHLDGPPDEAVVYAATHNDFGRSLDGGLGWDFPSGSGTYALAVDPKTPGRLYTEAGGANVAVSEDYAAAWTSYPITNANAQVDALAVDPLVTTTVYAGLSTLRADPGGSPAASGLYVSGDGGQSWERAGLAGKQVHVLESAVYPTGTLIYAGLNYDAGGVFAGGLYRGGASGGTIWEPIGLQSSVINDLAVDPSDPRHLLAGVGHVYPTLQPMGLYESRDGGDTWSKVVFDPLTDSAVVSLAFDRFDPKIIYVGAWFHLYRSLDGGQTWAQLEATTDRDFLTMFVPFGEQGRLFIGTGEGVYYRNFGGRGTFDPQAGGSLVFTDTLGFQAHVLDDGGAVLTPTMLSYIDLTAQDVPIQQGMAFNHAFELVAYQGGERREALNFQQPVTVTLVYPDTPGMNESRLKLLSWSGTGWEGTACGAVTHNPASNQLVAPLCQAGRYGLFVVQPTIFLPTNLR